jgi:agmatinase
MNKSTSLQFLGSELRENENQADSSKFQVIPCPMEKTVSYGGGTAQGPEAILEASHELERSVICEHGIFTQKKIDCSVKHELCLDELQQRVFQIVEKKQFPVTLGGEHSLTWAAVRGVSQALSQKVGVIQIDAHADLRHSYEGKKHSHASVMNLLVQEGHSLASLGVRAICLEEREMRQRYEVFYQGGEELVRGNISAIELPADFPEIVYVTFDLDGLDPSVMPAVGTPVPGGLSYYQSIDLVQSALNGRTCMGMDMVELSPVKGDLTSPFTAASLLQRLLAIL